MTQKQIKITLKKIDAGKEAGYYLEALVKHYHLNAEILKFIALKLAPNKTTENLKPKEILNNLILAVSSQQKAKTVITKKNLKMLKPWLAKMDAFFKALKIKSPTNTKIMLVESEKIFSLLNMSLAKIHIGDRQ